VRYTLEVEGSEYSPSPRRQLSTDNPLANRRRAAIVMEFVAAPHERRAGPAKRTLDTEHAGDDTTQIV